MESIDFNMLINLDTEYSKLVDIVAETYKCNWDDKVHDSYMGYLKQIQENSRRIHDVRCKTESAVKAIESLALEEYLKRADIICKEADSI